MLDSAQVIISRIETDLRLLKAVVHTKPIRVKNVKVPEIKSFYTVSDAIAAKTMIDAAFDQGLIAYDKKRGMKMMVTKHTEGWTP